jgi:peroxiredoxin
VGINADEPRRDVLKFIEEHDLTFEIVLDPDSRVQSIYSIRGLPSTFVIDRDGIIRAVHLGFLSEDRLVEYLDLVGVD